MVPTHAVMFSAGPTVWIVVIIILVVVFGASRLPDIARNVGKSAKVLKEELGDLANDSKPASAPVATKESRVQSPVQEAPKPENPDSSANPAT